MSARFRIRTAQGQELSFASHEMFAEFVRSGELSPDDVVYDAETHEWSSALTHPVVLQIESETDPVEGSETELSEGGDEAGAALAETDHSTEDIGLELAPADYQLSPDEAAAAFVKKMEAERASELEFDDESPLTGLTMEQGSSGLVEGIVEEAEPPPPLPAPKSWRAEPPPPPKSPEKPKKKRKKSSGAFARYAPLLIVGGVVAAAGVYFGPGLLAPSTGEVSDAAPDSATLPPPPQPSIPDTEEALRERAEERFLATTRALLRDMPPIPAIWLDGQYLAGPSDYPEVREAWDGVLTLIRQVRAGDNARYRAGYSRALDDALVEGSTRTLRLAGAVADFQGRVSPRAAHYDKVEALAVAGLRAHDALVEAEGTIAYEPVTGTQVSGDPVIQAVGRDPDAQSLLEQVLDMILAELEEPDGPGRVDNLGEWVWDGILGAVTG